MKTLTHEQTSINHTSAANMHFLIKIVTVTVALFLHLSPFNGHFPCRPGLAGTRMSPFWILLELRVMESVVITGAIRHAKIQSKCHHQQKAPSFLQAGCPSCVQPIVTEHWRKSYCSTHWENSVNGICAATTKEYFGQLLCITAGQWVL